MVQKKEFLKINTFNLKMKFEDTGADLRTGKIFSAKLGQQSVDVNYFFCKICQEIDQSCPEGITFGQIRNFERKRQNCKIECEGGMGWDEQLWPLH